MAFTNFNFEIVFKYFDELLSDWKSFDQRIEFES